MIIKFEHFTNRCEFDTLTRVIRWPSPLGGRLICSVPYDNANSDLQSKAIAAEINSSIHCHCNLKGTRVTNEQLADLVIEFVGS